MESMKKGKFGILFYNTNLNTFIHIYVKLNKIII